MQKIFSKKYIVGLVDGEGCFHVYVKKKEQDGVRKRVAPMFIVKLKKEDKNLLEKLKNFFGYGIVYIQRDRRKNHQTCYRYQASRLKDIKKIVKFFEENPLQSISKRRDFQLFSKIVKLISEKQHYTDKGIDKIIRLKNKMH